MKRLKDAEPQAGWAARLLTEGPQLSNSRGTAVERQNWADTKANSIFRSPPSSTKRMAWLMVLKSKASSALAVQSSADWRSEEHTSELQSLRHLVCRLLLE